MYNLYIPCYRTTSSKLLIFLTCKYALSFEKKKFLNLTNVHILFFKTEVGSALPTRQAFGVHGESFEKIIYLPALFFDLHDRPQNI